MSNPNYGQLATLAIESRTRKLADNVSNSNVVLNMIREKGGVKPFSGGTKIIQEIDYLETPNSGSYAGLDTLATAEHDNATAAEFAIKQYASSVIVSGLKAAQNSGKEKMIDLLDTLVTNAERSLTNDICQGLYSDGTGNSGKDLTGLQAAVPVVNTSGTYGGINRATATWWRNKARKGGGADFAGAITSTNVFNEFLALYLQLTRGAEKPNIGVASTAHYIALMASLQAKQQFTEASEKLAKAGFTNVMFLDCPVAVETNTGSSASGMPAATTYFLNTKYLHFRPFGSDAFTSFGTDPDDQDATVRRMKWYGNLTCSAQMFQGVVQD